MLSDFNNVINYNLMHYKFTEYYGFDDKEMDILLNHFNIDKDPNIIKKIQKLCNGYKYGKKQGIYNTWSVVNYLNNRSYIHNKADLNKIEDEWAKSGGFDLVENMILHNILHIVLHMWYYI